MSAILAVGATVGGCTFLDPLDNLTGGLTTSTDAGPLPDAVTTGDEPSGRPPLADAMVLDGPAEARADVTAMAEASTMEAGSHNDASISDAGHVAEAGHDAPTGPVAYWTFADDFDLGDFEAMDDFAAGKHQRPSIQVENGGSYDGCCVPQRKRGHRRSGRGLRARELTLAGQMPVNSGTIAVREWLRIQSIDVNMYVNGVAQAQMDPSIGLGIGNQNGSNQYEWGIFMTTPAVAGQGNSSAAAKQGADNKWHCVELVTNVSSESGQTTMYLDSNLSDVPMVSFAADMTVPGGWNSINLGLTYSSGTATPWTSTSTTPSSRSIATAPRPCTSAVVRRPG